MFAHAFIRHAFVAGTPLAAAAGLMSYFVVLRGQVFTGDALSHVAFTGAVAALAAGADARLGLFAATIAVGVAMALLGPHGQADDVVIGSVFGWVLGLGVLLLSFYTAHRSAGNGTAGVNVLFGSIFGLSAGQAALSAAVSAAVIVAGLLIARPLLFATVDAAVAAARGVPVRGLGIAFLALVGITAGAATQAVGALLLLGLLAAPGATAQRLTARPWLAMALAPALAVGSLWGGLAASYALPRVPPSCAVMAVASMLFAGSYALGSPA